MEVLQIDADISLQNISGIANKLKEALTPGGSIRLDISDIFEPHLCLLQLVEVARRHAAKVSADFALAGPPNAAWLDALQRAGFLTHAADSDKAFWLNGGVTR